MENNENDVNDELNKKYTDNELENDNRVNKKSKKKFNKKLIIILLVIVILMLISVAIIVTVNTINYRGDPEKKQRDIENQVNYELDRQVMVEEPNEWYRQNTVKKPIIYLYPENDEEVLVTLGYPEKITISYPEYSDGWNVFAKTDGTLLYGEKELYSLYYESEDKEGFSIEEEGFCINFNNVAEFLEEKLALLGLNNREAEEFIIYWLPKLQENEYNYIRFVAEDEIENNMPLEINPTPDTVIRVLMTYKGLDEEIEVTEQEINTPERNGFVVVEWGGTEIK